MDQLKLNGIEVECIIGDLPEERESEQRLLVDVALDIDLADAAESVVWQFVCGRAFGPSGPFQNSFSE